jgi:exo-beta-1,3-glucanase (GH17 family)
MKLVSVDKKIYSTYEIYSSIDKDFDVFVVNKALLNRRTISVVSTLTNIKSVVSTLTNIKLDFFEKLFKVN